MLLINKYFLPHGKTVLKYPGEICIAKYDGILLLTIFNKEKYFLLISFASKTISLAKLWDEE